MDHKDLATLNGEILSLLETLTNKLTMGAIIANELDLYGSERAFKESAESVTEIVHKLYL